MKHLLCQHRTWAMHRQDRTFDQYSHDQYPQLLVNELMKLFDKFPFEMHLGKMSSISDSL